MEIGKKTVVALIFAFVLATVIPVGAYMYFFQAEPQQIPSGITLQTPQAEMGLGIYWDSACTQNVTSIDFGKMWHPNELTTLTKEIWIRNEGNVTHTIYWNSTLSSITTETTDSWIIYGLPGIPLNGTEILVGGKRRTEYRIHIQPYATVGTYNWTLTVWAEHVH